MNDLNQMILLASEGLEARMDGDDERAYRLLKLLFQNTIPNDILSCDADFLFGKSFLQMLHIDIPDNLNELKKITELGFFFLTKSILHDTNNLDKISSRASIVLENEKTYVTIVKEAIEYSLDKEDIKDDTVIDPNDAVLLMLQYDFYKLGSYCNIIPSFSQKHYEITRMYGNDHFNYIAPDLNILGLGKKIHQGLYSFIFSKWFKS
uniref:hypothetical protein n=1 Tax=uncultured Draconibacterium sp. TaxID=1573823 RepID=UPI00321758A5